MSNTVTAPLFVSYLRVSTARQGHQGLALKPGAKPCRLTYATGQAAMPSL